jgi:hypothetical protein
MTTLEETTRLKLLGGVLIVLSVALLYCWCSKQRKNSNMYVKPRWVDGMSNDKLNSMQPHSLSELYYKSKPDTDSMHDRENFVMNRHPPTKTQLRNDISGLRWSTESMVGSNTAVDSVYLSGYPTYSDSDTDSNGRSLTRQQEIVGGDVMTPLKPLGRVDCSTLSYDILTKTNYGPEYEPEYATGAVSNTSVTT